jgi:hypothetical protein
MKIEIVLFVVIVTALFAAGFYYVQKRFWPQDRNNSRTAPPSPPEGVGNDLGDKNQIWRPPEAG